MLPDAVAKVIGERRELVNVPIEEQRERIVGVYFLVRQGCVVYVGQSTNVLLRISQHVDESRRECTWWGRSEPKLFDSVCYVSCGISDLCRLERAFIIELRPEYNGTYATRTSYNGAYSGWTDCEPDDDDLGAEELDSNDELTGAERHYLQIERARDLAFSFLSNTDEPEISAREMRQRLIDNDGPRVGLLRIIFMLEKDSRLKFDPETQSFRLASIPVVA